MQLKRMFGATVLFWGLACGMARADEADQKAIEAQYTEVIQAAYKGDAAPRDKAVLPDFKYVSIVGKEGTKETWTQEVQQNATRFKMPTAAFTLKLFKMKGEEATAVFGVKLTGEGTAPDGRMGNLSVDATERTLWGKADGGWKLKQVKHVMLETRLDRALVPVKRSREETEAVQGIQPIYDAMGEIYGKQDWAAIEKLIPDNLPVTDADGEALPRQALVDRLKQGAKNLSNPIMFITTQQVDLNGNMMKSVRLAKLLADVSLPDGKTGRLVYLSVARDTWEKGPKGWINKRSDELHSEATLDGKLIPLALFGGK